MVAFMIERRQVQGVVVLSSRYSTCSQALAEMGIPHRTLPIQDGFELPAMRPPILLDTEGMNTLDLARVLHNVNAGRMHGWKAGHPIPVIAVVRPTMYAHHYLLACSPSVATVMALPLDAHTLSIYIRRLGPSQSVECSGVLWFGVVEPQLPMPRPDLAAILVALAGASKLQDAAARCNVSKATFFRWLGFVCDALGLTRPSAGQPAARWLITLLDALDLPYTPR